MGNSVSECSAQAGAAKATSVHRAAKQKTLLIELSVG